MTQERSTEVPDDRHRNPEPLRVHFVPKWPSNPYHAELAGHLHECGVKVEDESRLKNVYQKLTGCGGALGLVHLHAVPKFELSALGPFRFFAFFRRVRELRKRGVKVVWTIHDSSHHEAMFPRVERHFSRALYHEVDGIIVHSEAAGRTVETQWGVKRDHRVHVIPHGHYIDSYPDTISKREARERLGLPAGKTVFLFLGMIRPYKGVTDLIRAYKQVSTDETRLVIAGKPITEALSTEIRSEIGAREDVRYDPGHVGDDDMQVYLNAADVVVFPYTRALTSGALILAMSYRRACIAPRIGALEDTMDGNGGYFFEPSDPDGLREAMRRAARENDQLDAMGHKNRQKAEGWPWSTVAEMTAGVYRACAMNAAGSNTQGI